MAKNPMNQLDEVEIIKRRDGVASRLSEPLDLGAMRSMADARLRALAFALGTERGAPAASGEIDDVELLEYLLDMLPASRRLALEQALRGDARVFGRLVTLRSAFDPQADNRDRRRADGPARQIPRHRVGKVEMRIAGDVLHFRHARDPLTAGRRAPSKLRDVSRQAFADPAPVVAQRMSVAASIRHPLRRTPPLRMWWGPKTGITIGNLLERAGRNFGSGMSLVGEARSLLARWEELNLEMGRRQFEESSPDSPTSEAADGVGERLLAVLRALRNIADQLQDEIDSAIFSTSSEHQDLALDEPSMAALAERLEAGLRLAPAPAFAPEPLEPEDWSETVSIEAGPWALQVSGTARPAPRLTVALSANDHEITRDQPDLTLIRPKQGFDTANLDADSRATFALPRGESVLLVQHEEVWEVMITMSDDPL